MLKSARLLVRHACEHRFKNRVRWSSQAIPQLSSEKYQVQKKAFSAVEATDVKYFKSILSEERVLTDDNDVLAFNIDWLRNCRGQSKVVLKPKTTEEVSRILAYCNERRLAVCPQGGNTSVVGGSVPVFDEIIISLCLMNKIISLDEISADGTILDCLKTQKKDNTGYHLKNLFVGSEGTLGIVTKVAIHCPVLPKAVTVGFFGVESFENVLKIFKSAKSSLGEILSAFEMMDYDSIRSTVQNMNLSKPIPDYPFYVLVETQGSDATHDDEKLNRFLSREMSNGLILNGTVASDTGKVQAIWKLRESIASAGLRDGYMFTYDVSLPLANYYELIPALRERIGSKATNVCGFGHIGDGNLHINVTLPEYSQEVLELLEPFIFEEVSKLQGSVSAEHGIGFRKPQFIHYSKDQSALQLMLDLKHLMDPKGILNPYKVLPEL